MHTVRDIDSASFKGRYQGLMAAPPHTLPITEKVYTHVQVVPRPTVLLRFPSSTRSQAVLLFTTQIVNAKRISPSEKMKRH